MNILYLETNIPPYCGGIERVSWNVSAYLKEHGYECFFGYVEEDSPEIDVNHKVKFSPYGSTSEILESLDNFVKNNNINIVLNQGFYYRNFCEAMNVLKQKYHVNVVSCVHYSINELFPRKFSLSFKLKDIICRIVYGHGMKARVLRPFYNCSDRLVMLSDAYCPDVVKYLEYKDAPKLCAIGNPLTREHVEVLSPEHRKKQALICARLTDPQKNITGALRIWKEIEKRGYEEWELVIAGTGPDEEMLHSYAQELGLKRITWLGQIKDTIPLYQKARIFMMTSNWEGRPVTIPEALQTGCVPIVFNSFLSLGDLITNDVDGLVINYPDEKAYTDALEELINDEEKWQRLSSQGISNSQQFSIKNIGKQWDKLFEKIKKENES